MAEFQFCISFDPVEVEAWKKVIARELENNNGQVSFTIIEGRVMAERSFINSKIAKSEIGLLQPETDLALPLAMKIVDEHLSRELHKSLRELSAIELKTIRGWVWQTSGRRLWPEVALVQNEQGLQAELSVQVVKFGK